MTAAPVRILVVEDDADDFLILRKIFDGLKRGTYELDRVETYASALKKLESGGHDLCLLDFRLEGRNGLELLQELRRKGSTLPVIFLTGLGSGDMDLEAMRLGASDFLHKDRLDPDSLERSIRYSLERRKAEENRFRLASIVESSHDAIYLVGSGGEILSWNPGAQRTYRYTPDEIIGRPVLSLVPKERQEEFDRHLRVTRQGKSAVNLLETHLTKNGGKARLSICLSPVQDPGGKAMNVSVIARDLTESERSRLTQETLRAERDILLERLQTYLEKMPLAFILTDPNFNYTYWNPAAQLLFGYTFDEVEGKQGLLIGPEAMAALGAEIRETVQKGGGLRGKAITCRRKGGKELLCEWYVSPLRDEVGQFSGMMCMALDITDRAASEKALAESEEGFRKIFQESPIGLALVDLDSKLLFANPGLEHFLGYGSKELVGRPFGEFTHPEDRDKDLERYRELSEGRIHSYEMDKRYIRKDGRVVWGHLTVTLIRNADGKSLYALGMVIDITERIQAEEAQRRLASILEQTQDGVVVSDTRGTILDWNQGAERIYGYKAREIIGRSSDILEPSGKKGEIDEMRRKIMTSLEPVSYETNRLRKDGRLIHIAATLSPMRDMEGRVTGYSAIIRDITEQKKAEEVRAQLAAILQQTTDAVVGTDLDGNIFSWNRGAENLFQYSFEEVLGRPATILSPEDRKHEAQELRAIVLAGENISDFETVRMRKDEKTMDVSISMSPIRDSSGKMIGVSAIHRDISERKKSEESLRQHEEQLRQIEKMNAIGRLAGGVAHDFNNLLSVIGGNAEFLKSSLDAKSPNQEEVGEIQKAVQRGADLAKQLLVFGQKQVSQPQPVNLNEVSADMKKMLKRLIDANVELAIIQDPDLRPILADPGQIQQIILNLVINARDAMPQGGNLILETKRVPAEKLEAEGRPTLPVGDYVRFAVTDTGTGMSPEVQRHIFEPFFTTKANKGTGLGLATVYTLTRKWSGHIFVHSSPGIGTTFTLYFPAMVSVEGFEEKPKQATLIPVGSETILLAEDEDQVRKVLVRSLERYGYKVLPAANGLEAVKVAWDHKGDIDLLLTDTIMPKMNGRELMVELKKNRPKAKVIFISGYPKEVLSQQGILDAGIHLIQKPFELEDLVQHIRRVLDEK
ncbi:MAG TPA: PAS domain S-box protein [bacterium]|nr:PAS domain S-box protein [bacterium]